MNTNNCHWVLSQVSPYLDGESNPGERQHVDQHLANCPNCAEHYRVEKHVRGMVRRCCQEAAPTQLRARVLRSLGELRVQNQPDSLG